MSVARPVALVGWRRVDSCAKRLLHSWGPLWVFGAALAALFPVLTIAQGSAGSGVVRGMVRDSLNGGAGLRGATVRIAALGLQAQTDQRGRFEFRNLPSGRHEISAHAALLDSIGIDTLRSNVDVVDRRSVDAVLATPTRQRYSALMCGGPSPPDLGIIRGRLESASMPDRAEHTATANVGVRPEIAALWLETHLGAGQIERREMGSTTSALLDTEFILCGVPTDADIVLRVTLEGLADTVRVFARIPQFVLQRNLVVVTPATSERHITIEGRVVTTQGQPMANASIGDAVTGEFLGRPSADGQFSLQRPGHSQQLMVRGIGYQPQFIDVEPTQATVAIGEIRLAPVPPQLATMLVEGRRISTEELSFEARRRTGRGSYIDEATLNKTPQVTPAFVASQSMIARTEAGSRGRRQLMLWRGAGPCRPRFYVDGIDNGKIDIEDEELLLQRAKRIEIYRAAFAPPEFNDFDGCGSIVIWTR